MRRIPIQERQNWQEQAQEFGFLFHTIHGEKYWDESVYYRLTLQQIEEGLEDPTEEIHQMCLEVVQRVLQSEELMRRFCIPEKHWNMVRDSWTNGDPSLYSRLDFAYDGVNPAKLYENNADTPTSLYEAGFWQWLWLEQQMALGALPEECDQFNSLQDKLVERFFEIGRISNINCLHISCCKDSPEDRGTVQYLEDCARAAGLSTKFVYVEDIGRGINDELTDLDDQIIQDCFKLYPWEFMFQDEYSDILECSKVRWLEPPWKAILSNKALLPLLWKIFPNHPNLLPSYFEDEKHLATVDLIRKPIFSREGANVQIDGVESEGPYGEEGFIYQARHILPKFGDNYTVIGSWLVDGQPAGLSIREDETRVTQDTSRFLPHVILA